MSVSVLIFSNIIWLLICFSQAVETNDAHHYITLLKREIKHHIEMKTLDKKNYKKLIRKLKRELEKKTMPSMELCE